MAHGAGEALLDPGEVFADRYRVVRRINAGGMGAVYEAVHVVTKRRCALKVMLPSAVVDPDLRKRFLDEAAVTTEIKSEHLVDVFDAGILGHTGEPYLVMELLQGDELGRIVAARGALPPNEVLGLVRQLAVALQKIHRAGIVHRDLKPENLFVTRREDGSPCLKVLDFGIAKIVAQGTQVHATRAIGSPLYMSPEQVRGDGRIGPPADLYASGHIGFTLLVGHAYWSPELHALGQWPMIHKMMAGAHEPASARAAKRDVTLPPSFDRWFQKATAMNPEDRFQDATSWLAALEQALGEASPEPPTAVNVPSAVSGASATSRRRSRSLLGARAGWCRSSRPRSWCSPPGSPRRRRSCGAGV